MGACRCVDEYHIDLGDGSRFRALENCTVDRLFVAHGADVVPDAICVDFGRFDDAVVYFIVSRCAPVCADRRLVRGAHLVDEDTSLW